MYIYFMCFINRQKYHDRNYFVICYIECMAKAPLIRSTQD